jgi:nucleotide-binding universal stress UspA family protein
MRWEKILLPIELGHPSGGVIHQAAALARRFHLDIVLLNVVTPLSYAAGALEGAYVPTSREDLLRELIKQARKDLDEHLKPEFEGLRVERILRTGDPASEIVECANTQNVSLIMMPTHGYRMFKRFLLGSVAAKVLHDSHVPVWTGSHLEEASSGPFTINHIVCGIDLGPHSHSTLLSASQLATSLGARLTLIHVTPALEVYAPDRKWTTTLTTVAGQKLNELQSSVGVKAETVIDSGDVARRLNQTAVTSKADLLVVGRKPSPGYLGGTGYAIIRESRIPVLSIWGAPENKAFMVERKS